MDGRSMFGKIFFVNIISMLVCIIILGSTEVVLMTSYISKQSEETLSKNAETIINLMKSDISKGTMTDMLNGFAHAMGTYIIILDNKSEVIACSERSDLVNSPPSFVSGEYTKTVLSGQKNSMIGTMGSLFQVTMFTLQIPVKNSNGDVLGAVMLSRPIPEHQRMKNEIIRIMFLSTLVIVASSLMLSYFLAKRISVPIHKICESTKEFAKGNFSVRVGEDTVHSDVLEIAELTDAFNNMAEELEKGEEIKNTFISDVSHELRTPMTTIGGFVAGILDETIPQDKQKDYLKIVYDEISRLSRLVNTFLDITRLQSDKLTLNKIDFDINELIRIVIIGLESKIEAKKIDVKLELESENCYVNADRDSITRVVTNLLDNAVKFTNEGGRITVTVTTHQHSVSVSIKNTGCGISKEQQPMIFKRFYKADKSRSRNREGTGIGLYLVKNILSAHGRDITLDSVEGEYADFTFTLDKGRPNQQRVYSIHNQ